MIIGDYGKLILLGVVLVGTFAAVLTHTVDWEHALGIVGTVTGYLIGNGRAAYSSTAPVPVLVAKNPTPAADVPITPPSP